MIDRGRTAPGSEREKKLLHPAKRGNSCAPTAAGAACSARSVKRRTETRFLTGSRYASPRPLQAGPRRGELGRCPCLVEERQRPRSDAFAALLTAQSPRQCRPVVLLWRVGTTSRAAE